jgi:hypothetical protein
MGIWGCTGKPQKRLNEVCRTVPKEVSQGISVRFLKEVFSNPTYDSKYRQYIFEEYHLPQEWLLIITDIFSRLKFLSSTSSSGHIVLANGSMFSVLTISSGGAVSSGG